MLSNYVVESNVCLRKFINESVFFTNHEKERKEASKYVNDVEIEIKKELRINFRKYKKDIIDYMLK